MKFILVAVFLMELSHDPPTPAQVESVEVWGTYKTLEACEKSRDTDRGISYGTRGLVYVECVSVKGKL